METKNFGMTEHYGVIMRNLVYLIKYSWYMHNIVRIYLLFSSTKKGCYKHIYYNLILATFPHEGFTSSLFKSHSTGIPIAIFSLGNGA